MSAVGVCSYRACDAGVFTRRACLVEGGGHVVLSLCYRHARSLAGAEV